MKWKINFFLGIICFNQLIHGALTSASPLTQTQKQEAKNLINKANKLQTIYGFSDNGTTFTSPDTIANKVQTGRLTIEDIKNQEDLETLKKFTRGMEYFYKFNFGNKTKKEASDIIRRLK